MYKHWRGPVYPPDLPQRRWFEHYASMLDTVEINNTFYRLPAESAVEGWPGRRRPISCTPSSSAPSGRIA